MWTRVLQVGAAAALVAVIAVAAGTPAQETVKVVQKKPPKYEYGYIVSDKDGNAQGHVQSRDGVYALGRYYVNWPNGSGQKVTYFADDWGYHPLVSYASTSARGSSRTQFAMGDKAIAALKDNGIAEASAATSTPSYTSAGLTAIVQQPSLLLVPPALPTKDPAAYTPTENLIPTYETKTGADVTSHQAVEITGTKEISTEKKTILHIPGLREALRLASEPVNGSEPANYTSQVGGDEIRLSQYLQPPDNISSTYNTDVQLPQEQLTEEQHQSLYASASYVTTTMKPIVVGASEGSPAPVRGNGQSSLNAVDQSAYAGEAITPLPYVRASDSSPQSSDSVVGVVDGRNAIDQLAPLQAGVSILSSEEAKPVTESVEGERITYKTVVDIQEGISLDVTQDGNGNFRVANFGERIPTEKPTQIQGLGYARRLVNPAAQDVVRETDPIVREQKQAALLARQEAEVLAVQKSIADLEQHIISQIDAEHSEQEKKHADEADSLQKVEPLTQDQNSIQSANTPVQVAPAGGQAEEPHAAPVVSDVQYASPAPVIAVQSLQPPVLVGPAVVVPQEVPVSGPESNSEAQIERESIGNNQVEVIPHRTVKSQNLAGILTLHPPIEPAPAEEVITHDAAATHVDKDTVDLVPPPLITEPVEQEPVLVEPYPIEQDPKLHPASPPPTLFPVIVEKPTVIESTKVVEKPVEYTKVVQVEKPVPVLQPYPVEVTKYVHVDRPVPVPAPYIVSQPVPVPVAVPHPVEVPISHLLPVPDFLPITLKEFYSVYFDKAHHRKSPRKPEKLFTPAGAGGEGLAAGGVTPGGHEGSELGFGCESEWHQGRDLQFSDDAFRQAVEHIRQREGSRRGRHRDKSVLKNLRIEYGFKPPLRPSVEITEDVKPSIYGPFVKRH